MFTLTYLYDREVFRVQWFSLLKWTALIISLSLARHYFIDYNTAETGLIRMSQFTYFDMIMAGLEEINYTLPIYFLYSIRHKKIGRALGLMVAAAFALGHLYQGVYATVIFFIWMGFIAPKYMKKLGLLTMIFGHIIYDIITLYFIKSLF